MSQAQIQTQTRAPTTMILAAGRGTRLRPLTDRVPKPMLEVGGMPLIGRQVTALSEAGVRKIVVNLAHLGSKIEDFLGNGSAFGVQIEYSREAEALETGGALVKAIDKLGQDPFWLHNGDIFTDFDYKTLPHTPPEGADIHLVLTPTPAHRKSGDFEFSASGDFEGGWIRARGDSFVYCGIAVVHPRVLGDPRDRVFSFRDLMFEALDDGRLSAQTFSGIWIDIGSPEQLRAAQDLAAS